MKIVGYWIAVFAYECPISLVIEFSLTDRVSARWLLDRVRRHRQNKFVSSLLESGSPNVIYRTMYDILLNILNVLYCDVTLL